MKKIILRGDLLYLAIYIQISTQGNEALRAYFHNTLFFSCKIFFSISFITPIKTSSLCPVGSCSHQFSSNALPMYGQPTSQPIEIAMSGVGILLKVLLYWVCSISMP